MGSQAVSHLTSIPRTPAIGQATLEVGCGLSRKSSQSGWGDKIQ